MLTKNNCRKKVKMPPFVGSMPLPAGKQATLNHLFPEISRNIWEINKYLVQGSCLPAGRQP